MNRPRWAAALTTTLLLAGSLAGARPPSTPQGPNGVRGLADLRAETSWRDMVARNLIAPASGRRVAPRPAEVPEKVSPESAAPAAPASGRTPSAPSPGPQLSFAALGDNDDAIPPDTNGAVGPNHLVVSLNTQVRIQTRSGGVISTVSLASFWAAAGGSDPFDPRTLYDPYGQRWISVAADGKRGSNAALLLAVSKTSDPTGGWYQWRFTVDPGGGLWGDFPTIGFNTKWIVMQVNVLHTANDAFDHSRIYAFGRSTLYGGGLGAFSRFEDPFGGTQIPATTFSTSQSTMYLVENWSGAGFGSVRVSTITGPVGAETYTGGAQYPSVTATWADTSPGGADIGPQAGTSQKIDLGDARMQAVVWRNGTLWATQSVYLPASSPSRSAVQWWQIGPRGDVVQFGRVDDSSGTYHYAYPSIAVNKNNDVLVGYSLLSGSTYASAAYSMRAGSDALSTMRSAAVLKAGRATYYKTHGKTHNRWGDYSSTLVDPLDDVSMWTLQEYAELRSAGVDRWGTWWGKIQPPPASGSPLPSVTPSPLTFSAQLIGSTSPVKQVTVKNNGSAPFTVNAVTISGAHASDFTKATDPCTGQQLWPGMSCLVDVTFTPSASGTRSASLAVANTASGSPHTIALSGTGISDVTPPVTSFRTTDGAISLGFPGQVFGTSTDNLTGVASVLVTWTSANWTQTSTVNCGNQLTCQWGAYNPIIPGTYTVRARATDALGNAESPGPVITITVI